MKRVPAAAGELKATIADLRRTIAWMDLALSRLSEGIVVVNEDKFRIAYANDAFAAMIGKPRILLLGSPIGDYLPSFRVPTIRASPAMIKDEIASPGGRRKVEVEFSRLLFGRQAILVVRDTER